MSVILNFEKIIQNYFERRNNFMQKNKEKSLTLLSVLIGIAGAIPVAASSFYIVWCIALAYNNGDINFNITA